MVIFCHRTKIEIFLESLEKLSIWLVYYFLNILVRKLQKGLNNNSPHLGNRLKRQFKEL